MSAEWQLAAIEKFQKLRKASGDFFGCGGFCGDGFFRGVEQVREKSFWNVADERIDEPAETEWHAAAQFDGFHLNVGAAVSFLDVPPGAEFPQITR